MITRRDLLTVTGASLIVGALPVRINAAENALAHALKSSELIYLTPIRSDGSESSCQSEVWFVMDGADLCVVTMTRSWRVRAVKKGLDKAQVWVGDLGPWLGTNGKYKSLPSIKASTSEVIDKDDQTRILTRFEAKYRVSWLYYGPRFRDGLADGTRTMLRYKPLST
jgi:hypothetical protein